jgi:hypothetical protein
MSQMLWQMRLTRSLLPAFAAFVLLIPVQAFAQGVEPFDVVKADKSESFSLPYGAANLDRGSPFVYTYEEAKGQNWFMTVDNTLSYVPRNDSKVVIAIYEQAPSAKSLQLFMYGGEAQKFAVALNTESGSRVIYQKDIAGWTYDELVTVSHAGNQGLTVTDGKRIVIDAFDIGGFNPASVQVYGRDEPTTLANASGGELGIAILHGDPADSPLYLLPAGVMVGVGALIGVLLWTKKRKQ